MTKDRETPKIRNLVAKHAAEFCKPKTFRNRKKEYVRKQKYESHELEHPKHKPYQRDRFNYLLEDIEDEEPEH